MRRVNLQERYDNGERVNKNDLVRSSKGDGFHISGGKVIGESKKVSFPITEDMLRFHRADGSFGSEPGKFMLWIGLDSTTDNCTMFSLLD